MELVDLSHTWQPGDRDHDKNYVPNTPQRTTYPIIVDENTQRVYKGGPGQFHDDMIQGSTELKGSGAQVFDPPEGQYNGRQYDTGDVNWHHTPGPSQEVVHQIIRAPWPPWTPGEEEWEDEPSPEQPRNSEQIWKNAAGPEVKVRQYPPQRQDLDSYGWRVPIVYSPFTNTVHTGAPGDYHSDITPSYNDIEEQAAIQRMMEKDPNVYPRRYQGFVSIERPEHRARYPEYNLGLGWLSNSPDSETHQAVQQALTPLYPSAAQNYVEDWDDSDWEDDDVPQADRFDYRRNFSLGSWHEQESLYESFLKAYNCR